MDEMEKKKYIKEVDKRNKKMRAKEERKIQKMRAKLAPEDQWRFDEDVKRIEHNFQVKIYNTYLEKCLKEGLLPKDSGLTPLPIKEKKL